MPKAVTYVVAASGGASDVPAGDHNLTAVSFCPEYWELRTNNGAYSVNNQFCLNFSATQSGDYRYIINKGAGADPIYTIYDGRVGSMAVAISPSGGGAKSIAVCDSDVHVEIDDANGNYNESGYISYSKNVYLVDSVSKETSILNDKITVTFDDTNMPCITNAINRVYIEDLGCYFGGGNATTYTWLDEDDLRHDWSVVKSKIVRVEKIKQPEVVVAGAIIRGVYAVSLFLEDDTNIIINMSDVANKTTWTNDADGVDTAYNEILSWL